MVRRGGYGRGFLSWILTDGIFWQGRSTNAEKELITMCVCVWGPHIDGFKPNTLYGAYDMNLRSG